MAYRVYITGRPGPFLVQASSVELFGGLGGGGYHFMHGKEEVAFFPLDQMQCYEKCDDDDETDN